MLLGARTVALWIYKSPSFIYFFVFTFQLISHMYIVYRKVDLAVPSVLQLRCGWSFWSCAYQQPSVLLHHPPSHLPLLPPTPLPPHTPLPPPTPLPLCPRCLPHPLRPRLAADFSAELADSCRLLSEASAGPLGAPLAGFLSTTGPTSGTTRLPT